MFNFLRSKKVEEIDTNHIKPKYYGYKGGFDNVTICTSCGRVGLYEDQHPADPCVKCGEKVYKSEKAGKFDYTTNYWLDNKDQIIGT